MARTALAIRIHSSRGAKNIDIINRVRSYLCAKMMSKVSLAILVAFSCLQFCRCDPPHELGSPLKVLERLIAHRQAAAADGSLLEQDVIDQQYQSQVRLLLAEIRCQLLGSKEAQEFFQVAARNGLPSADSLKFCDNYIVSYDRRLKHPIWVIEYLTPEKIERTGYSRAHLSSYVKNSVNARLMDHSACASNLAPQMPELNRGPWMKLERYVEHLARNTKNIHVITGALYLPEDGTCIAQAGKEEFISYTLIGKNRVAVPTHFYKVMAYETDGPTTMEAFVLPNSDENNGRTDLNQFRVDVEKDLHGVERSAGLLFFDTFKQENIAKPSSLQYDFNGSLSTSGEGSSAGASTSASASGSQVGESS